MLCIHCGKEIQTGATFCTFCGKAQLSTPAPQMQPAPQPSQASQTPQVHSQASQSSAPQQKKSRRGLVIGLIAAAVAVIAISVGIGMIVYSTSPARRLQEQLDLGARYLSELEYEQAVAAYEAALEIDPKSADAYGGLIQAYGGQGDLSSVADTYARATDALDESAMTTVSTAAMDALQEHAEEAVQEGRGEEVLQLLELITEHTENEEIKEKEDQIRRIMADKVLLWERPLYELILGGGYLQSASTYFYSYGTEGFDEPVRFALRDMDQVPDGIPEASIFNGNSIYASSVNCVFRLADTGYVFLDVMGSDYYYIHQVAEDAEFPGIFNSGAHTGTYWTDYIYVDHDGSFRSERIVTYTDEPTRNTGEFTFEETERTENADLFAAYEELVGTDYIENGTEGLRGKLRYFTQDEILEMGWEAFLAHYGYQSYLFTEYALAPMVKKDRPVSGPVAEEDLTEEVTEDIGKLAFALMMSLDVRSYENTEEIVRLFESEPQRMEMFFWEYYWDRPNYEVTNDQLNGRYYCVDVQTMEADRLFSELFGTTCDYSCLPTGFHETGGYPIGAFFHNNKISVWCEGFSPGTYPQMEGYEHTGNGTDLTVLYMMYGYDIEGSGEELGRIILHLESAPNSYGFRITGCDIIETRRF